MKEVEVAFDVRPSASDLHAKLTPRSMLEYAERYEVNSVEPTADGWEASITFDQADLVLSIVEIDDGYQYSVVDGGGMFEYRTTTIVIEENDETTVRMKTRYTFDSIWSFALDRLAAGSTRAELETTILNLVEDAFDGDLEALAEEASEPNDSD